MLSWSVLLPLLCGGPCLCCHVVVGVCVVVWWSVSLWGDCATQVHRAPVSGAGNVGGRGRAHGSMPSSRTARPRPAPVGACNGGFWREPEMLPGAPTAGTRGGRVTRPSVTGRATIEPPRQRRTMRDRRDLPRGAPSVRGAAAAPNSRKLYDREQTAQAVNKLNSSDELRR